MRVVAAALAWGCATGRHAPPDPDWVRVEVHNDLVPAASVVVHLRGDGRRVLLGDVPPAQSRLLEFRETRFRGSYTLEAAVRGATLTSQSITLQPGDRLIWQLRSNLLRVNSRGGGDARGGLSGAASHVAPPPFLP
jgi:hypothetical protein